METQTRLSRHKKMRQVIKIGGEYCWYILRLVR